MAGRFSVEAVFKAIDKVSAPVSRMQNNINKMTRSIETGLRQANKGMTNFGQSIKKGLMVAVTAATLAGFALTDVVKTGMEFEQTLVTAASKFGNMKKGSDAFKEIEEAAKKAGATTEFTAAQSAQALVELASAGFDYKVAVSALPKVIDLATAAQVDLGMATQMVSDSLGAFGLTSKDPETAIKNMTRVMDVMSSTADASTLNFEEVFGSFKKAGPIATAAGVNIETVASMLGIMGNAGIKAELAGTAVQNMLLNMASPSKSATQLMRKLGVSFKDSSGKFKDMPTIIDSLNKAMSKMPAPQKAAALETLFGREGLAGMVSVVSAGGDAFKDFRKIVEDSLGSTADKAVMMRDTFEGSFKSLMSAIKGVKISIFSMTSGPLKEVVDRTTAWVRANNDLIATKIGDFLLLIINNIDSIVESLKNIGIALGVFVALTTVLKTFVLTMTAVNLVMAMNPIGLIVLAVGALIAGLAALVVWIDDVSAAFENMNPIIQAILSPIKLLVDLIKWVKDNWGNIGGALVRDANQFANKMSLGFASRLDQYDTEDQDVQAALATIPQVISPEDRVARMIEEKRTSAEVTIMDRTGTAQISNSTMGSSLRLQQTGDF